jgi:hypothetical protein
VSIEHNPYRDIDLSGPRSCLAGWSAWETVPADAAKLGHIAWKLGFGHFRDDDIRALWRIGLLRADCVTANAPVSLPEFLPVAMQECARYIDTRIVSRRSEGKPSFVPEGEAPEDQLIPYFHPYKVYVLHHVVRTLRIATSSTQFLRWTPGVLRVVEWELRHLHDWTESDAFVDRFDHWNRVAERAAVCQPLRWMQPQMDADKPNAEQDWLCIYARLLEPILQALRSNGIHSIRQELALAANEQDGNSRIHTLLRLMKPFERERIEGRIGAAMKFLDMAESIRRATERLLQERLPEEDEIGPGTWFHGARKNLYGTDRVFDARPKDLRDFLGIMGLDVGVKVRCYVEGATEVGALHHAVGAAGQCILINLQGKVVERNGKGLAIKDSLAADKANHIFSFVVLDADREDAARVLRAAATAEEFHGSFRLFAPDLELANFTASELLHVALEMSAQIRGDTPDIAHSHAQLLPAVEGARSGKDFFRRLHHASNLTEVGKGEDWGAALMAYAIAHRNFPGGHPQAGQTRPIIQIAQTLINAQKAGFGMSFAREKVDASTGQIVERPKTS